MTRSPWAWIASCVFAWVVRYDVSKHGKSEVQARIARRRVTGTARSFTRPGLLVAIALLTSVCLPAASLGKRGGSAGRDPQTAQEQSVQAGALAGTGTTNARAPRRSQGRHSSAKVVLLSVGTGYQSHAGSAAVRTLQRRLVRAGYGPGPVDGLFGPLTEAAVERFQAVDGLPVDGIAGPRTLGALATSEPVLYPGSRDPRGVQGPIRGLQRRLLRAGYAPGPIDGRFGPRTERAVVRFQVANGLAADGVIGPRTVHSLRVHGGQAPRATAPGQPIRSRPARPQGPSGAHRGTGTHRPTRPVTPGGVPSTPKRVPVPSQPHHTTGPSSAVWLALAGLALVLLAAGAWLLHRRQSLTPVPVAGPVPSDNGQPAVWNGNEQPEVGNEQPPIEQEQPAIVPPIETPAVSDAAEMPEQERDPRDQANEAVRRLELLSDQLGAEVAYRRADADGDADAAFSLGVLLEQRGDVAGAVAAYKRAEERGHAGAACALGLMLEGEGYLDAAERAYRRADRAGDADGAFNLGVLLERGGDLVGAVGAYERAEQRGLLEAACNLGVVLAAQGDVDGAASAFRRADERGDARGAFNLGVLLNEMGDPVPAQDALRRAGERGSPEVSELAHAALREFENGLATRTSADQKGGGHTE